MIDGLTGLAKAIPILDQSAATVARVVHILSGLRDTEFRNKCIQIVE